MKIENMFRTFKNSSGQNIGEIMLYGDIGQGWGENSCKDFINQLDELAHNCSQINVRINSGGGEVFEGQAICSALKKCKTPTVAFIDGLCASIATVAASGCDKVVCASNGLYMVHSPLCRQSGNAHDMREMARLLDKIEEAILETYIEKCGDKCSKEKIKELLAGENNDGQGTWMTAKEAQEYGFVDEIGHELAMVAKIDDPSKAIINGVAMDLSCYQNLEKVKEAFENKATSYGNLPLAPRDKEWNAGEAAKRVRAHFKCEDKPNASYKKAFLWYDEKESDKFGAYKLPFADVVDGELKAVYRGLSAAKARLNQTDIPSLDKSKVELVLKKYYKKAQKEYNDPSITYNTIEETDMSNKKGLGSLIDEIATSVKAMIGVKNEVEPEAVEPQVEEIQEEILEQDVVAPEEQAPEEAEVPAAEAVEEPSEEIEPAEVEPSVEEIEPAGEEQQEEPVIEEVLEEDVEEVEPSIEDSIVPQIEAGVDLVRQIAELTNRLAEVTASDAEKSVKLAKAELLKEVEAKFKGIPGNPEDKVEKIFSIKNSNLSDTEKEFILNGLSLLSELNMKACKPVGTESDTNPITALSDDERKLAEAKALAQKENISENKALLVILGDKTLEQVKNKQKNK